MLQPTAGELEELKKRGGHSGVGSQESQYGKKREDSYGGKKVCHHAPVSMVSRDASMLMYIFYNLYSMGVREKLKYEFGKWTLW